MSLVIKEVATSSDRKKFVNFQFELYKKSPNWVPSLKSDEIKYLCEKTNPAIKYNKTKFFVAEKDGKIVGRIGAIINQQYNEKVEKKYIRFTKPEFVDDFEVSKSLISAVENYGKSEGIEYIHGPLGFTNLDTQGLLVEGFEHLQSIASVYHLPYYKDHFDKMGFEKENDWVEFRLTLNQEIIDFGMRGSGLVEKRYGFEVLKFTKSKELMPFGAPFFDAFNEAFSVLPYTSPLNDEMKKFYMNKYFNDLNPRYVRIVRKDGELVGFILPVPSLSKAFQKANGHLFPFGAYHILKAMKQNDTADFFLTGVRKKFQNSGVAVVLFAHAQKQLWDDGIRNIETTGVFESNSEVINNWKKYDHIMHKRRRCYVKKID